MGRAWFWFQKSELLVFYIDRQLADGDVRVACAWIGCAAVCSPKEKIHAVIDDEHAEIGYACL